MRGYNTIFLSSEEMQFIIKNYLLNSQTSLSVRILKDSDMITLRAKNKRYAIDINPKLKLKIKKK